MDALWELAKGAIALGGLFVVLLAIPTLFMFIFGIATSIDDHTNR